MHGHGKEAASPCRTRTWLRHGSDTYFLHVRKLPGEKKENSFRTLIGLDTNWTRPHPLSCDGPTTSSLTLEPALSHTSPCPPRCSRLHSLPDALASLDDPLQQGSKDDLLAPAHDGGLPSPVSSNASDAMPHSTRSLPLSLSLSSHSLLLSSAFAGDRC